MYVMNQFSAEREGDEEQRVVTFTVPPPEPEPQQEPEPQPRREPRPTNRPALAPAPNLGASLGGIAVSTPEYAPEELGQVSESLLGDLEDVAMTEDTVDQKPVINTRPISYPERARQRGIEGRVVVSALIGTNGRVQDFRILEASPPGVFEEAVRNAVPNWTFEPAQYNGEPVETWATIPIPFSPN
jgi:protein TonB